MTDNHKFQQKGVGAFRGGRNENHNNRNLTSSHNRISGGSNQLPSLSPLFQQTCVEQQYFLQQQGELRMQSALSPSSPTWQELVDVKEINAADKFSPSGKKATLSESPVDNLTSDPGQYDDFCLYYQQPPSKQQQKGVKAQSASPLPPTWQEPADAKESNATDKFSKREPVSESPVGNIIYSLFDPIEQGQEQYDDFTMIAPLTPKSLSNSPSMPTKPRQPLLESFDSDEEISYDTTGFFPSYPSIERRPF